MAFTEQRIVVGDTIDFNVYWRKDGVTWNITGGAITLFLKNPAGTVTSYSATISSGTEGLAHYLAAGSILDQAGTWVRQWKAVVSGVTLYTEQIEFDVLQALG